MNYEHEREETSATTKLTYLLIGGGIGAILALLFAPKSGADLRSDISEISRKGYDETIELAGKLKQQSASLYDSIKEKADGVIDLASAKLQGVGSGIDESTDTHANLINGEFNNEEKEMHDRSAGSVRRSSSIF